MKLPNRQIFKASGNKDARFYLNEPYLDIDEKAVVATDGHVLAVCPVELDDGDTSGPITEESIKAAIKLSTVKTRSMKTANVKANGMLVLDNGATYPRPDNVTFPDYHRVIPDINKAEMVISFDAKKLKDLADAINTPGSSVVTLHIKDNNTAFYVDSDTMSDCYGVLMPCRVK